MAATLPTAVLGRTGLQVTRLGYGTALYGPLRPHWTAAQANIVMNAAVDTGINFIDTAYDYTHAEEWIRQSLGSRYHEFHLATKCGCTDTPLKSAVDLGNLNNSSHAWTRDNLFRGVEGSLGRLKRDSVDIIQLHNPTVEECESGGLVNALKDMQAQGMVKWIGVSTTLPDLPTFLEWGVFDVMQIPYSALEREHEDWVTRAAAAGVGIVIRGGVAQGEHAARQRDLDKWQKFKNAGLDELLEGGESRSAFVLRFTLTHPEAHTIIAATTSLEHLRENAEAVLRGPLPNNVYAEAKRRLDAIGEVPRS